MTCAVVGGLMACVGPAMAAGPARHAPAAQVTAPPAPPAGPVVTGPAVSNDIGFPTVGEAMRALSMRADVRVAVRDGWMVFDDRAAKSVWAFPGVGTPPYPSAVKRTMTTDGTRMSVQMSVRCEAPKPACDKLVADFQKINADMEQSSVPKP